MYPGGGGNGFGYPPAGPGGYQPQGQQPGGFSLPQSGMLSSPICVKLFLAYHLF